MIKKQKLVEFIQRYYLAGNTDSVKLTVKDDEISCTFISDDSNVIGTVVGKNFTNLEDGELGIYTTGQLLKMLSVLDADIDIDQLKNDNKPYSLKLSDDSTSVSYMLADLAVIKQAPKSKNFPAWDVTIPITKEFSEKFLKAKSGMPEADNFAVISNGTDTQVVLNYATINTNRITFPVHTSSAKSINTTCFSANIFKEILAANKGSEEFKIEVSQAGIAKVTCSDSQFESIYYLLKLNIQ